MNCWVSPEEFGGYGSVAFGSMKTWEELCAFEAHHVGKGGDANGRRQQATNLVIHPISGTGVKVTHEMLVFEEAQIPYLGATGRYNDSLVVKTAKDWKFKWRKLEIESGFFKLLEKWQAE